ncbi:hypothetical protein EZS27_024246 [termite gut metagenome]|uniref:Chaperone protein Skp n=1 Tax=termite gut metagenome TaxID=433724 RepID=A0A5J4R125_9ZZZZ
MMKIIKFVHIIAVVAIIFSFVQCSCKKDGGTIVGNSGEVSVPTDLKIAYVEVDTLLTQYNFWKDLTEMMTKKEEDIRATLNQKNKELERDIQDFQRKYENNAFVSRERAEQEHNRILKKQQDLQELQKPVDK